MGRGLDALLGGVDSITEVSEEDRRDSMRMLAVDQIERGRYQPRKRFNQDALQELADSIAVQGVIQPIVVRSLEQVFSFHCQSAGFLPNESQ